MAPRHLLAAAVSSAALLGALAPVAAADPPWSVPTAVPGTGNGPAAVTARGHVATLAPSNRTQAPNTASQLVRLDPATGAVRSSAGVDLADTAITAYASDSIAIAGSSIGPSGTVDDQSRVRVGTGSGASGTPSLKTLSGTQSQNVTTLVGNARGDVALSTRGGRSRLIYLKRKGSGTFSKVLTISVSSTARGVTVALAPDGELLVAWEDQHEVFARHRGTSGTWGAVHKLGPGIQSDLQAAMDATGRMMVAWKSQRVNEGEAANPAVVSFITAAPGHGFGSRRTIETDGTAGASRFVSSPGVRLVVVDRDDALLSWTGFDGTNFVVRAAPVAQGHLGTRQTLSPAGSDAVLGDAAVGSAGQALVLWSIDATSTDPLLGPQERLFASVRAAGAAAFGAPEAAGGDTVNVFSTPAGVVDPLSGHAVAFFTALQPGASRSLVSVR
jgi:hypothetical protein